jgi:hypothetical protein
MPGSAGVTHITTVTGADPGPFPVRPAPGGGTLAPNSWGDYGVDEQFVGSAFDPFALFNSPRSLELEFRSSFFHAKQHDGRQYSMEASMIPAGGASVRTTQPLIGNSRPDQYVPMNARRPSSPYRLARKMTCDFTGMLFGQGRWPQMRCDDESTQAAAEALVIAAQLPTRFIQARNFGGSSGTAAVSWRFRDGLPVVRAHRGSNIHVLTWADEDNQLPAHVVELKKKTRLAVDPEDGKLKPTAFWMRRDWTLEADVVFKPCPCVSDDPPVWEIDPEASVLHHDGECHFVWIQNLPSEDDTEDGACDYGETFEQMNELDTLNSVNVKGVVKNLDPTLLVRVSEDQLTRVGGSVGVVKKGSDNAIITDEKGGADYLQLNDNQMGERTINQQRQQILEVCNCIVLDPEKAAAAASSGEAQKLLYAPMITQCDVLRLQWGPAIARVINQMLRSWRNLRANPLSPEPANDIEIPLDDEGNPLEVEEPVEEYADLMLKPQCITDEAGVEKFVPHDPGAGDVDIEWGPYFKPTGQDKQQITGALGSAAGGKPVLSQHSAVELAANLWDKDAHKEWKSLQDEVTAARTAEADLYATDGGGGAVDPAAGGVEIAPTDGVLVMNVNEVRKIMRQGPMLLPDGSPDPDGLISFVAYKAKMEAQQAVEGEAEGKENAGELPSEDDDDGLPIPPLPGLGD